MRQKASETDADLDEHILLLAVPALLSLLLDPLLTAADTAFVGKAEETLFNRSSSERFYERKRGKFRLSGLSRELVGVQLYKLLWKLSGASDDAAGQSRSRFGRSEEEE